MKVKEESEKVGLKLNIKKTSIMTYTRHFMAIWWRNNGNNERLYPLGLQNHCRWWLQPWNYKRLVSWRKAMTKLDSIWKSRDITLPTKVHLVKAMVFPVVVYGCENWSVKKAEHWRTDAFELWCWEKTLESPLDCKEVKPIHSKGNQSWIFLGRTDAEAEAPILWPPNVKNWLIGKDSDAGKGWRREEKGKTEDEMVGWHHRLDEHEFEQVPGVGRWTGKPGVLQSMGLQRVGHDWATELH